MVICFPHSGTIHWHALYRKWGRGLIGVFSTPVNVFINGVHLSPPACLASPGFSLELPKGMVYTKRERSILLHRKGWKSWAESPSSDCPIHVSVFPSERQLFIQTHSAATRSWKLVSFPCPWLHVCFCVCECGCHCLNLHGNDVPLSQAPAGIRGRGRWGGVSQSSREGKTASGVGVLKSINVLLIRLNLPFGITRGATSKMRPG